MDTKKCLGSTTRRLLRSFFSLLACLLLAFGTTEAQVQNPTTPPAPPSECPPRFGGAILSFSFECLNDTSIVQVTSNQFGWQYSQDSALDGIISGVVGDNSAFELYTIAVRETQTEFWVVLISNLELAKGWPRSAALNGSVAFGDILLNVTALSGTGLALKETGLAKQLYGVRFDPKNDSSVPLGVYRKVAAVAVGSKNVGIDTLSAYEKVVKNIKGSQISYGDFPENQTYFAKDIGWNVIAEGEFLGPIETIVDAAVLIAAGFDPEQLKGGMGGKGKQFAAFKFKKNLIIDECGVYGGDGKSCLDCKNVACGKTMVDQCEVCGGDGKSCLDCLGVPFGTAVKDQCGICAGDGKSCLDCKGVPFGTAVFDRCGVCGGDGTSCLDCKGTPNGTATFDQCGVCGGNGTSCLDCAGVKNGTSKLDLCGVCAGDGKSCLDCAGNPFGIAKVDECGVCNGNGKSCIDCAGVRNGAAKFDRCGVCNGDGNSCLGCTTVDISAQLTAIDGGVSAQRRQILSLVDRLLRIVGGDASVRRYTKELRSEVEELFLEAWRLTWGISATQVICTNQTICVSISNQPQLAQLSANSLRLRILATQLVRFAKQRTGRDNFGRLQLARVRALYRDLIKQTATVPTSSSSC
jgi:hypothetical protein